MEDIGLLETAQYVKVILRRRKSCIEFEESIRLTLILACSLSFADHEKVFLLAFFLGVLPTGWKNRINWLCSQAPRTILTSFGLL